MATVFVNEIIKDSLLVVFLLNMCMLISKKIRGYLGYFVVTILVFVAVLGLFTNNPLMAIGISVIALPEYWFAFPPKDDSKKDGPDKGSSDKITTQAATVEKPSEALKKNVSCSHCGAPNQVTGFNMTNCAYCGGNLA
jgi:hypothetical protein